MYKLLLSWRYLRTRFIALASIVSVTLGVATLIVVNSVMAGFVDQMKSRLHGILSDVEISAPLLSDIPHPARHVEIIKDLLGDEIEEVTSVVRTPALLTLEFRGRPFTQQIMLLGIDDTTFGNVTDFEPYLTNEIKKTKFSFDLEDAGYDEERFEGEAGWPYRRQRIENQRRIEQANREYERLYDVAAASYLEKTPPVGPTADATRASGQDAGFHFAPLPSEVPDLDVVHAADALPTGRSNSGIAEKSTDQPESADGQPLIHRMSPFDPHAELRPEVREEDLFDPMKSQHTGIILGIAISARKAQTESGELKDIYMVRPGDDANIMLTTIGSNPSPVIENCTVVDFYASNMHEYDSSFAFMPLSELQDLRGMIDPLTGDASVSTIQIKLKEGANLDEVRDKLIAQFPPQYYDYDIRTWQDTQRPLLSAVNMELTILNILLFLIIAVAGFGILATFFMIVVEKTKDIGILKALGAPSRGVMSIFLGYGMSLGTVGTGVGILLGLLFVKYINQIADVVAIITGQEVFDPTIYYFSEIPTIINPITIVWVAIGAIAIAVLASVLPALAPPVYTQSRHFDMSDVARKRISSNPNTENSARQSSDGSPLKIANTTVMSVSNLHKSYRKSKLEVPVLKGVDLEIAEGAFTAIVGQSGSGKSTLLHLLGTLDAPDKGEIHFHDTRIDNLSSRKQERLRNREFGMIFQFYHLLPELTTLENVLVPKMVQDGFWTYLKNKKAYKQRATEMLEMVGMSHRLTHKPNQLSGGEMQRTAIARSLISEPSVLLADEPTGNLDSENGRDVMATLAALRKHENLTVIMVTHDDDLARQADRVIHLVNGKVAPGEGN